MLMSREVVGRQAIGTGSFPPPGKARHDKEEDRG
jgi:hypothetical protein